MLENLLHKIPLPLGTSVGEVVESVAAGKLLTHLMQNDDNDVIDDVVDKVLAYTMVVIAVARKRAKH